MSYLFKNFLSKSQTSKSEQTTTVTGKSETNPLSAKEQSRIITEISDMLETLGFDTEHLLWIAKQNKEAFSTLVNHNQQIAWSGFSIRYQRMSGLYFPPIKNSVASTGQLNWSFEYSMMYLQLLITTLLESIYPKSAFLRNFRVLLK